MSRLDSQDPLILSVSAPELADIMTAFLPLRGTLEDVGDGIQLLVVEQQTVARFRVTRPN